MLVIRLSRGGGKKRPIVILLWLKKAVPVTVVLLNA